MEAEALQSHLRPVKRVVAPLREQLLENMRDAILSHVWKPGDRLIEREICEHSGASRASVREVFRQLESEGLVVTVANKGVVVKVVSAKETADAYALRAIVEAYAAREFCRNATEEDIQALKDAFADLQVATRDKSPREAIAANDRFFVMLARGANNQCLVEILARLRGLLLIARTDSISSPGRMVGNIDELHAIFDALLRRDQTAAEEAVTKHADNACRTVLAAIAEQKDRVGPMQT